MVHTVEVFLVYFFMDVGEIYNVKESRTIVILPMLSRVSNFPPNAHLCCALIRNLYILYFKWGRELSKRMKDGWTGQQSQ